MEDREGTGSGPRRLESWKEIAQYFRKGVTTVQRWEAEEGLPVHRQQHAQRGTVYAYPGELDEWFRKREDGVGKCAAPGPTSESGPPRSELPEKAQSRAWRVALVAVPLFVGVSAGGFLIWKLSPQPVSYISGEPQITSLTNFAGPESEPDLSPDGHWLAFVWAGPNGDNLDIYVKPVGGDVPRRITDHPAAESSPRWSPGGNRIAFTREKDATHRGIIVHDLSRSIESEVAVIEHGEREGDIVDWAPDGRDLLVSNRPAGQWAHRIELVNMRGERRPITEPNPDIYGDTAVSISPDGTMLAVVRNMYYQRDCNDLLLQPFDGGPVRWLTHDYGNIQGVAWLPDSRSLVFASTRRSVQTLWKITLDEGAARPTPEKLTDGLTAALYPSIARRETGSRSRVGYQLRRRPSHLYNARLDPQRGSVRPIRITDGPTSDKSPMLSPDGRQVAFSSNRSGHLELWLAEDGANLRRLTRFEEIWVGSPSWAPDGQQVLFSSIGNIYRTALQEERVLALTDGDWVENHPSWSVDGHHIYYVSNRSGSHQVWRQPGHRLDQARQLTYSGAYDAFESADGQTLLFTRDRNTPGLWSVPVGGGPEQRAVEGPILGLHWAVAQDGIYYLFAPEDRDANLEVRRYSLSSGHETLTVLEGVPAWSRERGFSVTPDGQWVAFAASLDGTEDIMLLDIPAKP